MWRVLLGTVFGVYLAQTYKLPSIKDKMRDIEKYIRDNNILQDKDNDDSH